MFEGPDADKVFTEADVANPQGDAKDSDVTDFANGKTDTITLAAGEDKMDVDAGIKPVAAPTGSISGMYFCDENGDREPPRPARRTPVLPTRRSCCSTPPAL